MRKTVLCVTALIAMVNAIAPATQMASNGWKASGTGSGFIVVTASSVESLSGSLSGIKPPVLTPPGVNLLLAATSCLGGLSPISAYGPLGTLGPIGDQSWNPSSVFKAIGDWSKYSKFLTTNGGPLSVNGPLGPNGPLGQQAYFTTLPSLNDFGKQLQAGGVWGILGPLGPLGALGPLGPLGPLGGHGYAVDNNGNYIDGKTKKIVTSVNVGDKSFDLTEVYTETAAKRANLDTSFMVKGEISSSETDSYIFNSKPTSQWVMITLVPEKQLDSFVFSVTDVATKRVIATSNSLWFINWAQIRVPASGSFKVSVSLSASTQFLSHTYRLIVTGSTGAFATTDIVGPHQKTL